MAPAVSAMVEKALLAWSRMRPVHEAVRSICLVADPWQPFSKLAWVWFCSFCRTMCAPSKIFLRLDALAFYSGLGGWFWSKGLQRTWAYCPRV